MIGRDCSDLLYMEVIMSIRVMLADDHILMREGIRQLLECDSTIEIVGEVSNGEQCIQMIRKVKPQVLLLDINMPVKNGIEVLKEIRQNKWNVKVLILTVHNEIEYLLKALDIGVDGYILKESEFSELQKAIHAVFSGESYIQPSLIPILNNRMVLRDKDKDKIEELTKRELEVLIEVANGKLNKEIANELKISERTVKNHISNIFKKIDVSDRTQAAVFAIKNDLIKLY